MSSSPAFLTTTPIRTIKPLQRQIKPPGCARPPCSKRGRIVATASTRVRDPLQDAPLGPPMVVCIGELLYDLHAGKEASIENRSSWTATPGGAPANLSVGLARLETSSAFIGNIGNDTSGGKLLDFLSSNLVNVDGVQKVSRPTREVFVRNIQGDRAFVGFNGQNEDFADTCELDTDALPGVLFYAAQIMVAETLCLAFPGSRKTVKELVKLARACKLRVVVDVNWRDVFWTGVETDEARKMILEFLREDPGADLVKLSVEEVGFLFGDDVAGRALAEPEVVLGEIGGCVIGVLVTGGSKGSSYAFKGGMEDVCGFVPAVEAPEGVVDTSGAGDAFLAGFLSQMLKVGGPFALMDSGKTKSIVEFAAAVAAFVVGGVGATEPLPSREMVERYLES